jgi:hypothetical protein
MKRVIINIRRSIRGSIINSNQKSDAIDAYKQKRVEMQVSSFLEERTKNIYPFLKNLYPTAIYHKSVDISKAGWYLSPDLVRHYSLDKLNLVDFEDVMLSNSSQVIDAIIKKSYENFPHRKNILSEIKECFDAKLYHAVINLAYSQADGICNENWGIPFFGKDKKELKMYIKFKQTDKKIAKIITEQLFYDRNELTMDSWIAKGIYSDENLKSFNRHLVIHGHSINYGSEINAIRAVLLIDFLIYFKNIEKEKDDDPKLGESIGRI